jgi:conjugal transfer pilus assembly protein TraL
MAMQIDMPKYVDSQIQILWWEMDEFLIAMIIMSVGLMLHAFFTPLVLMIAIMPVITKLKRSALEGAPMHSLFAAGLTPLNKEFTDALETEFYL